VDEEVFVLRDAEGVVEPEELRRLLGIPPLRDLAWVVKFQE
jgi:hypothetical protein